ncbi:hypothetical protein Mapa_011058 [Marchantia paleacea]|nr:hypothetical protein Mapa_011058 [Marchantia paleacea]
MRAQASKKFPPEASSSSMGTPVVSKQRNPPTLCPSSCVTCSIPNKITTKVTRGIVSSFVALTQPKKRLTSEISFKQPQVCTHKEA